jgi:hypothetical protein
MSPNSESLSARTNTGHWIFAVGGSIFFIDRGRFGGVSKI